MSAKLELPFLLANLHNGDEPIATSFARAVDYFRIDPLLSIPQTARALLQANHKPHIVFLGSNGFTAEMVELVDELASSVQVVDDFKCHRGETLTGAPIISTDVFLALAKNNSRVLAINTCPYDFSKRFFNDLCQRYGITCLNFEQAIRLFGLNDVIDYRRADWGPTIVQRAEEFQLLAKRLSDPYSVHTLYAVLLFHLTCNSEWYMEIVRPYHSLYFRSGLFKLSAHEKLVDCGASIGESTLALIGVSGGQFDRSWMIEPDRHNIITLKKLLRRFQDSPHYPKLSLHPFAVGDVEGKLNFHHIGGHGGNVVTASSSNGEVDVKPIDKIIDDSPTMIKMDIEGSEEAALRGAREAITSSRPKLLVSAYHRASDLLDLTACIDSMRDDYKIGLRHHTDERWDTCLYFY